MYLCFLSSYHLNAQSQVFKFYEGDTLTENDNLGQIFVLKNNLSCMNCFYVLDAFLTKIKTQTHFHYYIGTHSDSGLFSRKRNISYTRKTLPNAEKYLTYFSNDYADSVLNIKHTPALLVVHKNDSLVIPYQELLDETGMKIPTYIQNKIRNFIE